MNYYEEILKEIKECIENKEYEQARRLIENELSVPYVPRDVERQLQEFLNTVKEASFMPISLTDEDIEKYLFMDEVHQLMAVDGLNKRNLREYIDLCQKYLSSQGYINAKALLIDSLIRQGINHEFSYGEDSFNPKEIMRPEESAGFLSGLKAIQERFMKYVSIFT